MKHLMRYEGYTAQQRVDDLLDKISNYGLNSLNKLERDFLDAHKIGKEEEIHNILTKKESECTFEDDSGMFKFEFDKLEKVEDEFRYYGTIYLPSLTIGGKVISGKLYGYILYHTLSGFISPEFYKSENGLDYEIFDFCSGNEYELDSFLEYVITEIEQK
jgi:hypothetical protein